MIPNMWNTYQDITGTHVSSFPLKTYIIKASVMISKSNFIYLKITMFFKTQC